MTTIEVPKGETGVIRVFAINKAISDMQDEFAKNPKADVARSLLGDPHLDTTSTEVFPLSDLAGVGLSAYLTEGYAVPESETAADNTRLQALDGYVLLLFSDSFAGQEKTLAVGPDLTLIGSYSEFSPQRPLKSLSAQSAAPYTGAPAPQNVSLRQKGIGSESVILIVLGIAAALLWWAIG